MGIIKTFLGLTGAALAGIYLTSDEGKSARLALRKKKSALEPIVKDLLQQANDILTGSKQVESEQIRINVENLANEAKQLLIDLDLEKAVDTIKNAIKVASRKIRDASNDIEKNEFVISSSELERDNTQLLELDTGETKLEVKKNE